MTNGTPIPDMSYEVITAENVSRLRQIARYGYPRLLDENPYRLTADSRTIDMETTADVEFYDAHTQELGLPGGCGACVRSLPRAGQA